MIFFNSSVFPWLSIFWSASLRLILTSKTILSIEDGQNFMIKYHRAPDIEEEVFNLIDKMEMCHIRLSKVICLRSTGSGSRGTIARCHALPKIMQQALGLDAHYVIEVISERFDKMQKAEQVKVLIHELLHIPKAFGGGFRHHDFVNRKSVDKIYREYENLRAKG